MNTKLNRVFSARTNLSLYSLLLLLTPFVMLQNYLQDGMGMLSDWSYTIGGVNIPFLATAFVLFMLTLLFLFRRSITGRRLLVWLIILGMWILGQQISDYYLDVPFYYLQHNWHYIAYGLFSFLAYQVFSVQYSAPAKIILRIFFMALIISTSDEIAQVFISSRIFDISDIAKDTWGVLMGIIFLFFIYNDPAEILKKGWVIRERKLKDYLKNPLALIIWMVIFALILLFVSASLTESQYAFNLIFITLLIFFIVFFIVHKTGTKGGKWFFSILAGVAAMLLVLSMVRNSDKYVTNHTSGIILYKGIPIPYFDVMIFENGCFRIVDKKASFNQTDRLFLYKKASNILLIGGGEEVTTRMGFPKNLESQFVFNNATGKGLQVIVLPTDEACRVYKRLKKEKKKVTFIIHNN